MKAIAAAAVLLIALAADSHAAQAGSRYFNSGDGRLSLATNKGNARFNGIYRNPDGSYDESALRRINQIFLARYEDPSSRISPRLIEFIDFIQDRFAPNALVTITSGYRSPRYNTNLRNNGALAAKASLHQYGMAADLCIKGVSSEDIWNFIKETGFGGAGFYHGKNIHIDVGPARSWDETTSGVGTDISEDNKLIGIVADRDIYLPGEAISLRFIRMTAFPIGVGRKFVLEEQDRRGQWKENLSFAPTFAQDSGEDCPSFSTIAQMSGFEWNLPDDLKPGRYRVRADFCESRYAEMPAWIATPEFEVRAR